MSKTSIKKIYFTQKNRIFLKEKSAIKKSSVSIRQPKDKRIKIIHNTEL